MGHAKVDGDEQDEQHNGDERRNREQRETSGTQYAVQGTVGLLSATHGEWDSGGEREDLADDHQFEVNGNRGLDRAPYRALGDKGRAEVAVHDVLHPHEVLLVDWLIETQLGVELRSINRAGTGAQDDHRRVTGQ